MAGSVTVMPPRLASRARTSKVCPGTGAAISAGGANPAPGPVGSGNPAGCAMAVSSTPMAELIASWNCRSLTSRMKRASRSFVPLIASRVSFNPCTSAGTVADGLFIVNAAIAFATASSMAFPDGPTVASIEVGIPSNSDSSFRRGEPCGPSTRV